MPGDEFAWPELLVGGAVGVAATEGYRIAKTQIGARVSQRRRTRRARNSQAQAGWQQVVDHYRLAGSESELYLPTHVGSGAPTPLLVDASWIAAIDLDASEAPLLTVVDEERRELDVEMRLIKRRQAEGARLFDDEILYVKETRDQDGLPPHLLLGNCSYFSYATLALRLEREFRRSSHRRPLIDTYFRSARDALARPVSGLALGCLCATVFMTAEGPKFAVHQRSDEVLSLGSLYSLAPMFGVETNRHGDRASRLPLLQYNFAKEFAEEFYDLEEVIHAATSRRVDPDWLLRLPEMAAFEGERQAGRLALTYSGMCISPLEGVASISMLAVFEDPQATELLLNDAKANFESRGFELVSVNDKRLDQWAENRTLGGTSVFALDRARAILAEGARTLSG